MRKLYLLLVSLCLSLSKIDSAKIVALVPFPCKSHAILGSALLRELARRGHEVTMISSFPTQDNMKNYRDIYVDPTAALAAHTGTIIKAPRFPLLKAVAALECTTRVSDAFLSDPSVKQFLADGERFDLVVSLGKESLLGVGHALNASTIRFNMLGMHSIYAAFTMNPLPSAYVPHFLLPYSDDMSFFQRTLNTIMNLFFDVYIKYVWIHTENAVVQKHFPGAPHLTELQRDVDVTFVNSHMAMENVRPHMPNVIQIGGFHLKEKEILPKDIKTFLDNATQGVILFSMGSSIRAEVLQDKLNEALKCFATLPYQILWKHDEDVPGQPDNVKTIKWLPQKAVLSHPNLKLFITHAGLGSVLESLYYAVPMIALPIYLDQHKNAAQSVRNGVAIQLDVQTLTADRLLWAIREMTANPAYANEIAVRSAAFRHQEVDPMQRAVYWVEQVIKHKNANYLKCIAKDMPMFQYYLLDVFGFIFLFIAVFIAAFSVIAKKLWRCSRGIIKRKVKQT